MNQQIKSYLTTGFFLMAVAVALGAFGAHGLKNALSEHYLEVFQTANRYHFIHALGIIAGVTAMNLMEVERSHIKRFFWMMMIGMLCFSTALYMLSIKELIGINQLSIMGAIAPIGGTSWIAAWCYGAFQIYKK